MSELKLGSSQLANPQAALRLGKILSARVLVAGSLVRYKGQLQVNLRAIDTENTQVIVNASGTCQSNEDPGAMVHALVGELQERIIGVYPIRGCISEVQPGEMVLNVGRAVGVSPGMRFRLAEGDEQGIELTVIEVEELASKASPGNDAMVFREGLRIEQLQGTGDAR